MLEPFGGEITDVMDTRAQVGVICHGNGGVKPWHNCYSVLACNEGILSQLLVERGWVLVGKGRRARYLCPECAQTAEDR